ncbi:MAG TPA: AAA family ATPase [Stellaceae bacterium]|nr:AAA family ATPase [Stellaceae bacterium]
MIDDQQAVITFLSEPSSYGPAIEQVEIIETHVSLVFLAGDCAYKLKRAVKYPYLDFSTSEHRRRACDAELALNRRTAPTLYLEVRALARMLDGKIGFAANGPAIDWVVVMRRFEQSSLFDALAQTSGFSVPLMNELAGHIADFHAMASRRFDYGGAAALNDTIETNHCCLVAAQGAGFALECIDEIREKSLQRLAAVSGLVDQRRAAGKVRRCHGDLHLRNICLVDGKPTLFDCLEFSDALASIDVLYDLAFLLMDLEHRGLTNFASLVLNRYLDLTDEDDGLPAMPLFLSLRAAIRAHVTATAIDRVAHAKRKLEMTTEARRYLDLAARLLRPRPCRLIAIGGLSGSGKSTLAAALAPKIGARVLRSDVTRKRLFGVAPETRLPAGAYTPEASRRVYDALRQRATAALAAGYSVIIDAVSLGPEERQSFASVAKAASIPFSGLWLAAPASEMERRLRARCRDASDASPEVLAQQLRQDAGPVDWVVIDAGAGPEACLAAARHALVLG